MVMSLSDESEDPIVALATPFAPSALAVIRTSGAGSIELLAGLFSRPQALTAAETHSLVHGTLSRPDADVDADSRREDILDEVVVAVYRAPRGYTGEDSAEISCHGSLPGIVRILDALSAVGFRHAEPGEFTRRAFGNGRLDLTRAEAVQEVVSAKTRAAHALALDRLQGRLQNRIEAAKKRLVRQRAALEVQLDYPDDEVEAEISADEIRSVRADIGELASSYERGRLYQEGVRVAIAGPTNAGKSSLFNLLLRQDRAIVSPSPGTTRDYIEAAMEIGGVPMRIFDTAGFREVVELVEHEGIARSGTVTRAADLVLYVVEATLGLDAADAQRLQELADSVPYIVVWNKVDLLADAAPPEPSTGPVRPVVRISATTGMGLSSLEEAILARVLPQTARESGSSAVIDSLRQKRLLERASECLDAVLEGLALGAHLDLIAVDLKDAVDALGEITGEVTSADVLDEIFSGFCVGK